MVGPREHHLLHSLARDGECPGFIWNTWDIAFEWGNCDRSHLGVAVRVMQCTGSLATSASWKELREPKGKGLAIALVGSSLPEALLSLGRALLQ